MDLTRRFLIKPGMKVDLSRHDPDFTAGFKQKKDVRRLLTANQKRMDELQYLLYAEHKQALLIVLQAMDAGGKDGTIRHVLGPLNPQGVRVTGFKKPTPQELAHDYLWRIHKAVPANGQIGIFNRSHYEDVLVVRVHDLVPPKVWRKRYGQINAFERLLAECNVHILKFYLHISKGEQLERLNARLRDPKKHWKANPADYEERKLWGKYMEAFEAALSRCSTKHAPWFVIPANKKWFRNLAISQIILETLESMNIQLPAPEFDVSEIRPE